MELKYTIEKATEVEVHVLCTSIATQYDVDKVTPYFNNHNLILRWSIDLQDWEKILKVVSANKLDLMEVKSFLHSAGYEATELTD